MSFSAAALDRLLTRAGRLYSLPAVAVQVLELANHPRGDVRALKECIEKDPALTTKVLRVVNSSLFGLAREVSDLNQALALLGVKPLLMLVLGFSLPDRLFAGIAAETIGRYWRRTLTKAVAARELVRAFWRRDGEEAFIAGLLDDIGMLLLMQELGEPYTSFVEQVRTAGGELIAVESTALGFDHLELSAKLLESWQLPATIVQAVEARHDPRRITILPPRAGQLGQALHLAELLATLLVDRRDEALEPLLAVGAAYARISREQLDSFVATLQTKVEQLAGVLSLTLPEDRAYVDVLAAAHEHLARLADETLPIVVRAERARENTSAEETAVLEQAQSLAAAVRLFAQGGPGRDEQAVQESPLESVRVTPPPTTGKRPTGGAATAVRGVGVDSELEARLGVAVAEGRQARQAVSLLLIEIDRAADLIWRRGPEVVYQFDEVLKTLCRGVDHAPLEWVATGDARGGLILGDCDRNEAVQWGTRLVHGARQSTFAPAGEEWGGMTLSIGVATVSLPARNFPPRELIDAASRCLSAARSCGGNTVKSIGL